MFTSRLPKNGQRVLLLFGDSPDDQDFVGRVPCAQLRHVISVLSAIIFRNDKRSKWNANNFDVFEIPEINSIGVSS